MPHLQRSILVVLVLLPGVSRATPPLPGGILDSTGRTAYLASSAGIDAVGIARGELLWSTREAHRPLLVAGDRLYALVLSNQNLLHVRGFDLTAKGKRVYQSDLIELPGWVVTGEAPGRSFRCTWQRNGTTLVLNWQAAAWSDIGPRKEAAATVRIDLEDGSVRLGKVGPLPLVDAPQRPVQLEKLSVRWQRSIGGRLHALVLEDVSDMPLGEREKRLVLRVWNEKTGKQSTPRELLRGIRPMVLQGLDGIHLWVRDAAPSPDEVGSNKALGRYHWAVYSGLDGHLVARVPFLPGTQEATLIGDRAYFLTAALVRGSGAVPTRRSSALHAVDVESGKTLWDRPLSSKALQP
jgi:hypothetical protein